MVQRKTRGSGISWFGGLNRLPWWTGMVFAALGWAGLHELAAVPEAALAPAPFGRPGGSSASGWRAAAGWGQYLLPLLIGAATLWLRGRFHTDAPGGSAGTRDLAAWRDFDAALCAALAQQGYQSVESGAARPDAGADRVLRKDRQTVLLRCRHWKVKKVTAGMVQAHCDAMAARGAEGGIVVTSGRFSREAIAYAQLHNVKLIDGPVLDGLVGRATTAG